MKLLNTLYNAGEEAQLSAFIKEHQIADYKDRALVKVFAAVYDREYLERLLNLLNELLPHTPKIGITCFGAIMDGRVYEDQSVLSFCLFDNTTAKSLVLPKNGDDFQLGVEMANRLTTPTTQAIVTFSDALQVNKVAYLQGLSSVKKDVTLIGGGAAHPRFEFVSLIFNENGIVDEGAVGASLNGDKLRVITGYELNWTPIGRMMKATKATGNRLYELDEQPAVSVFNHYLGENIVNSFATRSIFPIILHRNGIQIARVAIEPLSDGSITFQGDVNEGDYIQFSYGHLESILGKNDQLVHTLGNEEVEGLFLYSCAARKVFMGDATQLESLPYGKVAPTSGYFTYGEFYDVGRNVELLNTTFTYVAFSEKVDGKALKTNYTQLPTVNETSAENTKVVLTALTHLTKTFTDELNAKNAEISNAYEEVVTLLEQVNAQKAHIERQNEDILDSIRYAKRIQTAFLPDTDYIRQRITNLCLFYRPRDIVSGDFYWYAYHEPYSIFAVVDCTGHGVPGAFMTMVGNSLLNRLVNEMDLRDPGKILEEMDKRVIDTLKQQAVGGSKDGMDVSLIVWDHAKQEMHYSGANRPMYFMRNGTITEIKGTKLPIGDPSYTEKHFEVEQMPLYKGDRIYLFSDGYVDQMGGPEKRKLTPKRLKESLESWHNLPMKDQEALLEAQFLAWLKGHEQLDDVCVVGIEV